MPFSAGVGIGDASVGRRESRVAAEGGRGALRVLPGHANSAVGPLRYASREGRVGVRDASGCDTVAPSYLRTFSAEAMLRPLSRCLYPIVVYTCSPVYRDVLRSCHVVIAVIWFYE